MGWMRMTLPSRDSCTDPATIETSMAVRAHRRPHAYGVPAELTTPPPSASRVTVNPAVASRARRATPEDGSWRQAAERLLMPLPTNPEQEAVARRLADHRGVTVQGPPGTGKTHTIANLISHLVGHGKRVLVTSQKEQALSVLREKI
jgi:primosomal protein N'